MNQEQMEVKNNVGNIGRILKILLRIKATVLISISLLLAAMTIGASSIEAFTVIPPSDSVTQTGKTYGEWSVAWWKYILETPLENNPAFDATGSNCNFGQQGPVFFLVGTSGGNTVRNECVVPAGKILFFPLLGIERNQEMTDPYPEISARSSIQGFVKATREIQANIDGQEVSISLNPKSTPLRTLSPEGFFIITAPENNIFGRVPGQSYDAVSDGFYLMVAPLSPGPHTIIFGGATRNFSSFVTYNLNVAP